MSYNQGTEGIQASEGSRATKGSKRVDFRDEDLIPELTAVGITQEVNLRQPPLIPNYLPQPTTKINNKISKILYRPNPHPQPQSTHPLSSISPMCSMPPQQCQCTSTTECTKRLTFLQNKLRSLSGTPYQKQIASLYDIEQMGLENKSYLVEYTDGTLEKVGVKIVKKYYLDTYVGFLERVCFGA